MLTKATLTNFQCHKYLELDFAKFTTLTGGSNGGKTSVLRAIIALVRNDSAGPFVRRGQKSLSVKLEFDDGYIVEWLKGSGENKYLLTGPDGNTRTFDKVGSEAPDEVKEVLRLGPIAIKASDKEYVNFHTQLEAPFIIGATPGNVAKLFGELTSASQLYTAVGDGNKTVRSINALKSTRSDDIKSAKESLEDFIGLDDQVEITKALEAIILKASQTTKEIDGLSKLVEEEVSLSTQYTSISTSVGSLEPATDISLDNLTAVSKEVLELSGTIDNLTKLDVAEEKGLEGIGYLESGMNHDLSSLMDLSQNISILESHVETATSLDEEITKFDTAIPTLCADILCMETGIDELFESVEECPECGQTLSDTAREALLSGRDIHATH